MSEVLVVYNEPVRGPDGTLYDARVCGAPFQNVWEGWIEFIPRSGAGAGTPLRTPRETEQPSRAELGYWATGLTMTYLDGALARALRPVVVHRPVAPPGPPPAPGPAPSPATIVETAPRAVLDPFQVHEQGERVLLQELSALDEDHLRNIVRAYRLHPDPASLAGSAALVTAIVAGVKGGRA